MRLHIINNSNDEVIKYTPDSIDEDTIYATAVGLNKTNFFNLLNFLAEYNFNSVPLVSDAIFDTLVETYELKYGTFTPLRAVPWGEKVALEDFIGGLDKIKKDEEIERWCNSHAGPFILQDKIDGISITLTVTTNERGKKVVKLCTTGDGYTGEDVSNLLPYLKLPLLNEDVRIRCEMAMTDESFLRLKKSYINPRTGKPYSNARAAAGAIINASKQNVNPDLAKELTLYALNILSKQDVLTQGEQVAELRNLGFVTPNTVSVAKVDKQMLHDFYDRRKKEAGVIIDGLVIYQNIVQASPVGRNPTHIVAFKGKTEIKEVVVTEIKWRASKNRLLKPTVYYDPTQLSSGVTVQKATGHNANTVVSNNIGPGAKILITRSNEAVPQVVGVITPASGTLYPDENICGKYFWNESHKELVLYEDNDEVKREKLKHFTDTLEIKNLGRKRIEKLYTGGINDINKLLTSSIEDLSPIIGPGLSVKVHADIQSKIKNVPLAKLLDASGIFPNIGETIFESVLETHPTLLYMADMDRDFAITELQSVPGIKTRAIEIIDRLPLFVEWLDKHSMITVESVDVTDASGLAGANILPTLEGKVIVFSGFRTGVDILKKQIKARGGKVTGSVSKNTSYLVVANTSDTTGKPIKAQQLGIPIIQKDDFSRQYLS